MFEAIASHAVVDLPYAAVATLLVPGPGDDDDDDDEGVGGGGSGGNIDPDDDEGYDDDDDDEDEEPLQVAPRPTRREAVWVRCGLAGAWGTKPANPHRAHTPQRGCRSPNELCRTATNRGILETLRRSANLDGGPPLRVTPQGHRIIGF